MTGLPDHFCPGCGAPQHAFPRYPWHFCNDCLGAATDGDGRGLVFGNAALSGGLSWAFADTPQDRHVDTAGAVRCLIRGRPALVHEARFGGVVAEPLRSGPARERPGGMLDLSKPTQRG